METRLDGSDGRAELEAEIAAFRAEMRQGFARVVTRDELGDQLRLHIDASVGAMSRRWFFSAMGMQAATIAGVIAAVRL